MRENAMRERLRRAESANRFVLALFFTQEYLKREAQASENRRNLALRQQEYAQLVDNNNVFEARIEAEIDDDEIYRIATEELGMVYPQKYQVINYDSLESEYVRQNGEIPQK